MAYKKFFKMREDDTWVPGRSFLDCKECSEEQCTCKNCDLKETCPEGSQESGGKCKRQDNSGYLKNVCAKGYHFDKVHDTCVRLGK